MDLNSTTLSGLSVHDQIQNPNKASSYILNGKIMLCSVIVLFVVVVVLICFQSYTRWLSRRHHRHRHRRSHHLFLLSTSSTSTNTNGGDNNNVNTAHALDLSVLKRLPSFVFSSKTHDRLLDCAVCLSEFEDNEEGRVLPACKHAFHADCIDMWFHSHSSCPLCRTPVQLPPAEEEVMMTVIEPPGSVSEAELGVVHQMGCSTSSSSSSTSTSSLQPVELVSVLVEIPRGLYGFGK